VPSAARNPWVALDVTVDPVAHERRLRRVHERGVSDGGARVGSLRALVHESWKRSVGAGVLPDQGGAPVRLVASELGRARERSPLMPVVGVIHSTLSCLDEDARQIIAIGDERANLLWVTGDPRTCERAREMRFQEGAAWSEHEAGTNAVGTAALLDHPVQIFSAEHLVAAVHSWTCSAAPIHDPATGKLIGVIDITADLRTHHPHTLSVAMLAARAAEAALQLRSLRVAERLRGRWEAAIGGRRTPCALLDARGRVIASRGTGELAGPLEVRAEPDGTVVLPDGRTGELEALGDTGAILWLRRRSPTRRARVQLRLLGHDPSVKLPTGRRELGLRSLELLAVLAMHRDGLTTEQLALALYGERGKTVTIPSLSVEHTDRC
jgi:hypothetical protein